MKNSKRKGSSRNMYTNRGGVASALSKANRRDGDDEGGVAHQLDFAN